MKQNKHSFFSELAHTNKSKILMAGLFLCLGAGSFNAQVSYSFVTAGATGSVGPTQAQVTSTYAATNLNGSVTVPTGTPGIQLFTIPTTGAYRIEARGGQGVGPFGGRGAIIAGDFTLTAGTVLKILVGQKGELSVNASANAQYGGGGGSFITSLSNTPYVVAGGGGGSFASSFQANSDGTVSTSGNTGIVNTGSDIGAGGTGGNGGNGSVSAEGGGGLLTNAVGGLGMGYAFVNGGSGGSTSFYGNGGFGGGGGTSSYNDTRGGGGGGYSGGGGAHVSGVGVPQAGGGGSYNNGINQTNTTGANLGQGMVIITSLCNVVINGPTAICSGNNATLTTNAVSNYSWSNGNTTSSVIVVSPTTTTTYSVSGTGSSPAGCNGNAAITITVSPGVPTLAVTSSTNSTCLGNTVSISATGALTYTFSNGISNGVAFVPNAGTNNYTVVGGNGCGTSTVISTVTVAQLPITTTASSTLICSGTPATLTANGAASYTWNPGATNQSVFVVSPVSTTVYTISGTTGSCQGTAIVTITTKANPTLSIVANHTVLCAGDGVTLTVIGNASTYTWSPVAQTGTIITDNPSNLTLYSVTGTNSLSCKASAQQPVIVNPLPVINTTVSNPLICSGGASTLAASGASTYVWSSGATTAANVVHPVTDQTYTVTGTSSLGCIGINTASVSVFVPTISISSNTAVCSGGNAAIGAGVADTYSWSNGQSGQNINVSPTLTTVYTVTASVNNLNGLSCPASNSVQVTINPNPVITATGSRTNICIGESTSLTAEGAGANGTYLWNGGSGAVASATNVVAPIANQNYTVTGTDANGCKGKGTISVAVSICQGISVNSLNAANLSVYPNPSNGEFNISSDQAITLQISNGMGQLVKVVTLNKNTTDIKLSNLPDGVYFITGSNENGSIKQKIVIAK